MRRGRLAKLRDVQTHLRMETCDFRDSFTDSKPVTMADGSPVTEGNVTEFIRERTRIWRGSWVTGPLAEVIKSMEGAK